MTWLSLVPREDLLPWLPTEQLATFAVEEVHRFSLDRWKLQGFLPGLPVPSPKDAGVEEGEAKLTGQGLCLGSQPTSQGSAISLFSFEVFFFLLFFCASFKG